MSIRRTSLGDPIRRSSLGSVGLAGAYEDDLADVIPDLNALEFGGVPGDQVEEELTVISDPSQLNFAPFDDGLAIETGGYSSEEETDPNANWNGLKLKRESFKFKQEPHHPVPQGPEVHVPQQEFSQHHQPHQHQHQHHYHQQQHQQHPPQRYVQTALGQNQFASSGSHHELGQGGQSSPSKRMKRRLSANANKGMLRASSVPQMPTSGGLSSILNGGTGNGVPASALPPLKERAERAMSKVGKGTRKSDGKATGTRGKKGGKAETVNRRHRHNESERVRMRTIAAKIAEMKELMEDTGIVVPKEKAKILTGAVEYMKHLKKVAMQKSVQLSRVQEDSAFGACPLPSCVMDASCNYVDSNSHFTRCFGQPHKPFPSAVLLVPDWIYGRSIPQRVGLWLDMVQGLRSEQPHRLESMQLEDQCVQQNGKPTNFRIMATLINYHPSSSPKDIRILLTFFPLPAQPSTMGQLIPIKSPEALFQQTSVGAHMEHSNQSLSFGSSTPRSQGSFTGK